MNSKYLAVLFFVLAGCALCFPRQEDSIDQLMAKADSATGAQQADLCMEVADRELKLVLTSYKGNHVDDAHASLQQIVKYADTAHSAAIHSGKRLKHTEIKIRRISGKLQDLKFNTEPDEQPLIQAAVDKLEDFRTELLNNMFGSKSND